VKASEYLYSWEGEEIRVVVAGDLLALPGDRWSMGGFGQEISAEWLRSQGRIPAKGRRREALISCLIASLATHHRHGMAS
jgi:hypothetical protein